MVAAPVDQVRTLYRTLLVYAAVSILILVAGLAEFAYFEPPGQHTGLKATITGVFQYDPASNTTAGPDRNSFPRSMLFAAVVDWSSLPKNVVVDARWEWNLLRQVRVTHAQYAGKPWHDRHLAAEDGPVFAFIEGACEAACAAGSRIHGRG